MSSNDDYIKKILEEKARAEADKAAVIAEFNRCIPAEWTPDDLKDKVRDLLAESYARIKITISDDDNPALAYKAAKDMFDIGIGRVLITDGNDPQKEFKDFIAGLQPKTTDEKVIEDIITNERAKNSEDGKDSSTDSK